MNVETTSLQGSASINNYSSTKNSNSTENSDTSFKQELNGLKESQEKEVHEIESSEKEETSQESNNPTDVKEAIDGLEDVVEEVNKNKNNILQEKDLILINNDMNIPDGFKQKFEAGMNFNSNGQNFSEFMQNNKKEQTLALNVNDLKEENEILSTMAENIAIANKLNINMDKKNSIELESNINFDSIIMNKSDVDFFVNLVNNQEITLESLKESPKSAQISKTLFNLLTKAMNENKPVRIDFDNDISIIIRISRDGKISADFLPSSQVAEAYLKENLPLLKQRFDEENIEYNELNQRKQEHRQKNKDENKKGRDNE